MGTDIKEQRWLNKSKSKRRKWHENKHNWWKRQKELHDKKLTEKKKEEDKYEQLKENN